MIVKNTYWKAFALAVFMCSALVLSFGAFAVADDFPDRPIKLVIPMNPGGSHDAHARAFAGVAHEYFGQPVLAVIKSGANGTIGASFVANSRPDGYTLLLGDQQAMISQPLVEKTSYSYKSFVSIGRINYSPMIICVHADAPYKTLAELVAYAKKHPNKILWGGGTGVSNAMLTMMPWVKKTGIDLKGIPYSGGGPQLLAFLKKDNDLGAFFPSVIGEYLKKGTVRALAIASPERIEAFPDVPTFIEQGFDHQYAMFRAIFAPKDVPADRVEKLRAAFDKTVKDKSFQSIVKRMEESVIYMDGKNFDKFMVEENARIEEAIKDL